LKLYNFNVKSIKNTKFINVYFYLYNDFYINNIKISKRLLEVLIYFEDNKVNEFISRVYYSSKISSKKDFLFILIYRKELINPNLI